MATGSTGGGNVYNTKSPQTPGDLFALHQSFDGFMQLASTADWPDDVKKVVTDSVDKDIAQIETAIVAELNAQMQAGKVQPGGVSFQGVNYTIEGGQLVVEQIPDASTLSLLTTPFGGGAPPIGGGGGGGTTTTGGGTDTTTGGAGGTTPGGGTTPTVSPGTPPGAARR